MANKISASSNKRLAKNTLLLYVRTLLVMAITLFTSRVILASLGVEDFGTYNAIGGFVAMFSLLGGTLVKATQRFINVELGKKEDGDVNKVFCTGIGIHVMLSAILLLLFETFGLWFLNNKMNFPEGSLGAANVVFQFSIVAFILNILGMPFNAVVIAFERMKAFAYVTLLDAILKLAISYALFMSDGHRLVLYAGLLFGISVMNQIIYVWYCRKHFPDVVRFHVVKEKNTYIRQTSFAGYTFLGSVASVLSNQGVNLVLNLFCGVTVNAARGISMQVHTAVTKFVTDFMTALNPQITKTYASGDVEKSMDLVYRGAKFSFYLVLMFSVPLVYKTPEILNLWLKNYPDYAVIFVQLTLIYGLVGVLSHTIITEILATGKIKGNALIIGGLRILTLPISYVVLKLDYPPYYVFFVMIVIDTLSIFTRLFILRSIIGFGVVGFVKNVLVYAILLSAIVFGGNYLLNLYFTGSLWDTILYVLLSFVFSVIVIVFIGFSSTERKAIESMVLKKMRK